MSPIYRISGKRRYRTAAERKPEPDESPDRGNAEARKEKTYQTRKGFISGWKGERLKLRVLSSTEQQPQ